MTKDSPYCEAPNIGYEYDLIYIHSNDLAECIGSESTGPYYIIENNEIVGSNKDSGYLQESINKTKLNHLQLIHIGKLRVNKVNKWGSHKYGFYYAIEGIPVLFEFPIYESDNTIIWDKYIKELIKKYNWVNHLNI
jgi:hypothetical protein